MLLQIKDLHVSIDEQPILKGVNLSVMPGEVHAIMGPNGAGKSTLASVLAGKPNYQIDAGEVLFCGADLLSLTPEARAVAGLFLGFQYPVDLPGVNNLYFIKTALNSIRKQRNEPPLDAMDIMALVKDKMRLLSMDEGFLKRAVNHGFSGGEKKRNAILQMLLLEPTLAILDETDSGLDIDALQVVAKGVNSLRDAQRSMLVVTHYQRLLNYIQPDKVHVLLNGKIVASGDKTLAVELEAKGYGWLAAEEVRASC